MKRVVAFGTFDIIHPGHLWFLNQASRLGDELIVVVSRDAKVRREKGKPKFNEQERLTLVSCLKMVSRAVLGDLPGKWTMINKLNPDVIAVGFDQNKTHPALLTISRKPKIVHLKAFFPKKYKSSLVRTKS